jgi:LPXTG-motif cell wall-anchored protein
MGERNHESGGHIARASRAAVAGAILGVAALTGTVAHAQSPVMTGTYDGTNSDGSPMQLGVYDPDTAPAPDHVLAYWNTFRMDTSGPFLSYSEAYPTGENNPGYTSCSRDYGGFALFTGPNTFAGTHSNTQGTWTLEGTIDAYGHATGTLSATLNSGVNGIPAVECVETFTLSHPDAVDAPVETTTTTTTPATTTTPPSMLQVTGDATSFVPGQTATFTGAGFQPGESVTGTFFSDPIPMGTVTADAEGRAVFAFAIPPTVAAGQHTVRLVGATSGTVELAVTVAQQPVPVPALPATGDSHTAMLVVATALVAAGAMLVRTRQRPDVG